MNDSYTPYEIGVDGLLLRLKNVESRYSEGLTLRTRLSENIDSTRRYGDTETLRHERARIIEALNVLSLETCDITFNDLYRSEFCLAQQDRFLRSSEERCLRSWLALGLPYEEAESFLKDARIGDPKIRLGDNLNSLVTVLIGELGLGKTLIAERLFQQAVRNFFEKDDNPIPVYLHARDAVNQLETAAKRASHMLGDPETLGTFIVIDGVDELGSESGRDLIVDAQILAHKWHGTKIVITSRPLWGMRDGDVKIISVPPLTEDESYELVSRVANVEITQYRFRDRISLHEAIRRPLFAILVGLYYREKQLTDTPSQDDILSFLVERSLRNTHNEHNGVLQSLKQLAVQSLAYGGSIPISELRIPAAQVNDLLQTRLIIEHRSRLEFPLAILTEWFAANALRDNMVDIDEIMDDYQRIHRWYYVFVTFLRIAHHDDVSKVLVPLAKQHPAIAAILVKESIDDRSADSMLPPPLHETGQRIRDTMIAWVCGIDKLASLIAPVDSTGNVLPVGIRISDDWVVNAWYHDSQPLDGTVVKLPPNLHLLQNPVAGGWRIVKDSRIHNCSAWAWRWSLDELVTELSNRLRKESWLFIEDGAPLTEALWLDALAILRRGSLYPGPLSLSELQNQLSKLNTGGNIIYQYRSRTIRHLLYLKSEVDCKLDTGEKELYAPWPGPDKKIATRSCRVWEPYSIERVLERSRIVYQSAMDSYQRLVNKWFHPFIPLMPTAALLPARLTGLIIQQSAATEKPIMRRFFQALPMNSSNEIDIRLADDNNKLPPNDEIFQQQRHALIQFRPDSYPWISRSIYGFGDLEIWAPNPVTKIVFSWLWSDLKAIEWVEGFL